MAWTLKPRHLWIAALLPLLLTGCQGSKGNTASPSATASSAPTETATSSPSASPAPTESASASPSSGSTDSPAPSANPSPAPVKVSMGKVTALRMADYRTGWSGGEGWIARTDDSGKKWTVQYSGHDAVHQLFALNDQKAWATLDNGNPNLLLLLQTTDGGSHWSKVGTVPSGGFLHFISDKEAFVAGMRTSDGGKTWTKLPVPKNTVGDVYYHDLHNGWAVTQANGTFNFLHTPDGGKSWDTVMTRKWDNDVQNAIIRSTGKNDAWIELIGGTGMTQTSYSLFHTADGGKNWTTVLANYSAGGGPAPGYSTEDMKLPKNGGASPGTLYVVNPSIAFMGGQCEACDKPNTMGRTTDGGKTWVNGKDAFAGFGEQYIAAADADHVWWINTDVASASVMYISADGGKHWTKAYTFDKPRSSK